MKIILAQNNKYPFVFAPRDVLENDEDFKQVIPYLVLRNEEGKIALFQRYSGNEKRLSGKKTVGIGGHIDYFDLFEMPNFSEVVQTAKSGEEIVDVLIRGALIREAKEETGLDPWHIEKKDGNNLIFLGNIEIDLSPVDRVHKGYVYSSVIQTNVFYNAFETVKERELLFLGFLTKEEILEQENIENWSRFALEKFF